MKVKQNVIRYKCTSLDFIHNSQFGFASFYSYLGSARSLFNKMFAFVCKIRVRKGGSKHFQTISHTHKQTHNKQAINYISRQVDIEMQTAPANMRNKLKCWFVLPDIFAIQIKCINSHKLNSQNSTHSLSLALTSLFSLFRLLFFFICDAMLMKMLKYLACRLLHSWSRVHNEQ